MEKVTLTPVQSELVDTINKDPFTSAPVIEKLKEYTGEGKPANPADEPSTWSTWGFVVNTLLSNKLINQACEVAMAWYDSLCEHQSINHKRYHKGASAQNLGVCFMKMGEMSFGAWFHMCAFVEDVLSREEEIPQTPATQNLSVHLGYSRAEFKLIAEAARTLRSEDKAGSLWRYPEATLVKLARNENLKIPLLKNISEFPLNRPFFRDLISALPAGDNNDKKKSLEFLASYLMITLPGIRIKTNVKAFEHGATFEHEIDLVATQYSAMPTYLLEAFGRHFLIECKNWDATVGVRDLNHFVAKMRFHRCKCGIIFSQNGLSGDKSPEGLKYARVTQLRWYQQDDCIVIVVTKEHLEQLASGASSSFMNLVLRGYEDVRFNRAES